MSVGSGDILPSGDSLACLLTGNISLWVTNLLSKTQSIGWWGTRAGVPACRRRLTARLKFSWPTYRAGGGRSAQSRLAARPEHRSTATQSYSTQSFTTTTHARVSAISS